MNQTTSGRFGKKVKNREEKRQKTSEYNKENTKEKLE